MVSIKHKVRIKTKNAQEEIPAGGEIPAVTLKRKQSEVANEPTKVYKSAPESEKKYNTGKIIGGVAAVAAILAGVYFFGIEGSDKTGGDVIPPTTEVVQAGVVTQPEDKKVDNPSSATNPVQQAQSSKNNATAPQNAAAAAPIGGDVVENAKRVIRGEFGNGQERKDKLGSAYAEIQSKVNEIYRQGLVY